MKPKELYCPHHNVKLVLREARHGINRGNKFWGCPTWNKTKCNYTVPVQTSERIKRSEKNNKVKWFRNKNGQISILKILKKILMIPIYIIGFGLKMLNKVYSNTRQKRY